MEEILTDITNKINTNINLLPYYNLNKILECNDITITLLLNNLCNHIDTYYVSSYKKKHYEPLIVLISKIIINTVDKKINYSFNDNELFTTISQVNGSHLVLRNINRIINLSPSEITKILTEITENTTFLTFMFWWNKVKVDENNFYVLLKKSVTNSDDRILKYLLSIANNQLNASEELISILFSSYFIPKKNKLHKLHLITQKFTNPEYFKIIINNAQSLDLIYMLAKYYYHSPLDFNTLSIIINKEIEYKDALNIYSILKTEEEKHMFIILCNVHGYYHEDFVINNINWDIVKKNSKYIILHLNSQLNSLYLIENKKYTSLNNKILKYCVENRLIEDFLKSSINATIYGNLYWYTKFFYNKGINYVYQTKVNKVLHLLRCLLKRKINKTKMTFKIKFTPIIKEINSYQPSDKFITFNSGSYNYQLNKQKFNKIPPRHILPMEDLLNKKYLIKEKADGVLIVTTPVNICPETPEILEYEIKAEYIEELNIYLVFDINIPNTTIYDRYILLRSLHYATQNILPKNKINNFNELMDEIKKERQIFNNFINSIDKKCGTKILWYPKCCWEILMDNNFYMELCQFISETSIYTDFILEGEFKNDGLILTPLDGSRELKVKPKKYQTIDLIYKNNGWYDSDNNIWELLTIPNKKYKNKVYRCYPIKNTYTPIGIRYDKNKPNSYFIVDQIINIHNFDWLSNTKLIDTTKYYENTKPIQNNHLKKILTKQVDNLKQMIGTIKPEINKNWLDLGCGKCKLFNLIKETYYPNKYVGMDNDVSVLSQVYGLVDETNSMVNLHPCNLKESWNTRYWSSFNWSLKYNYIVANFSLSYFWSELFWEQLNRVTLKGSIFIFNLVDKNKKWVKNDSYLESNEETTKMYFSWAHDQEHQEAVIDPFPLIEKYGWKIINKHTFDSNGLESCYSWYTIMKL